MSLGIDEGAYPFGETVVERSEIAHEFTVMRLSLLWIRKDAVGLVQILHLRSCQLGIALEFVRMIALGQCLESRFDHDRFGCVQQAENGVVVLGHHQVSVWVGSFVNSTLATPASVQDDGVPWCGDGVGCCHPLRPYAQRPLSLLVLVVQDVEPLAQGLVM